MRYALGFLLFVCNIVCSTQLHGQWQISGRLLDNEKNPLEAGIVVASVDTSFQILAHAVTNVAGYFELKILDSTLHTLYLQANYLGYSKQTVFIKKGATFVTPFVCYNK